MAITKTGNAKKLIAKAIEKLSGYGDTGHVTIGIVEYLLELAEDETPSVWIPCSERLPEDEFRCNVSISVSMCDNKDDVFVP